MGTYTTNYQLYMPSVGEQGWGTLINDNYSAIDTVMKGLSNRLTAVENEVNGALSCTSVATSGTVTSSGIINANGGVKGGTITGTTITATDKFSGTLYGKIYVNAKIATSGEVQYATCPAQSVSVTGSASYTTETSSTITVGTYSTISLSYPYKLSPGIYIASSSYLSGSVPSVTSRKLTFTISTSCNVVNGSSPTGVLYVNGKQVKLLYLSYGGSKSATYTTTVKPGDTIYVTANKSYTNCPLVSTATVSALTTYYIQSI